MSLKRNWKFVCCIFKEKCKILPLWSMKLTSNRKNMRKLNFSSLGKLKEEKYEENMRNVFLNISKWNMCSYQLETCLPTIVDPLGVQKLTLALLFSDITLSNLTQCTKICRKKKSGSPVAAKIFIYSILMCMKPKQQKTRPKWPFWDP